MPKKTKLQNKLDSHLWDKSIFLNENGAGIVQCSKCKRHAWIENGQVLDKNNDGDFLSCEEMAIKRIIE